MFLYARIIGVLTYTVILVTICFLLKRTVNTKFLLVSYTIILAIMAFNYIPYYTADLFRLYDQVNIYGQLDWNSLLMSLTSTNTPVWLLYCKLIHETGIRELLPASAAVIFFGNTFYIIYKSTIGDNTKKKNIALLVFFEMAFGQYLQVISGIRSLVAFSIIARCVYDELFEGKSFFKDVWLYILAALLHVSGIVAVAVRVIYEAVRKENRNNGFIKKILLITIIFATIGGYGMYYFRSAANIAYSYFSADSYSYNWEYLLTGLHLLLIIYLVKKNWWIFKKLDITTYARFVVVFIVIVVGSFIEYSTFQRFTVFVSLISLPLIASILDYQQDDPDSYAKTYNTILLVSVLCLLIAVTRGNLCALKFFE